MRRSARTNSITALPRTTAAAATPSPSGWVTTRTGETRQASPSRTTNRQAEVRRALPVTRFGCAIAGSRLARHDQGEGDEPAGSQLRSVGDVGREPGGDAGEQGRQHQPGGCVGRADDREAQPGCDGEHQQVTQRVGPGGERGQQVGVGLADERVDHDHRAGLRGRHRDDQGVEQAVPVVADPGPRWNAVTAPASTAKASRRGRSA